MWKSNGMTDWKEDNRCSKAVTSAPGGPTLNEITLAFALFCFSFLVPTEKKIPFAS